MRQPVALRRLAPPNQAAIDKPELFNGVFVCAPNFRELHVAEQPPLLAPLTSAVQARVHR